MNLICTIVIHHSFAGGDKIICISDFKGCHIVYRHMSECDWIINLEDVELLRHGDAQAGSLVLYNIKE